MAGKRGKLEQKAHERGFDSVEAMVSAALEQRPSVLGAAGIIGVAPNALIQWMSRNRFAVVTEVKARLVRSEAVA